MIYKYISNTIPRIFLSKAAKNILTFNNINSYTNILLYLKKKTLVQKFDLPLMRGFTILASYVIWSLIVGD